MHPEPYAVWVAEIMAQQTRLGTMLPYYERWLKRFPDIASLARAEEEEVLASWEGLGYYSRARNLHKAAQLIVREYEGVMPNNAAGLRRLPGIGPYTAGAIASLAFGMDEAAVDGNAKRVLSRLFDINEAISSTSASKRVWDLARELLPSGKAADFNQALMDLGASLCNPRQPQCEDCPLQSECKSFALGNQLERPVRTAKADIPLKDFAAGVFVQNGKTLIRRRPVDGLLGGMWEFPNVKLEKSGKVKEQLLTKLCMDFGTTLKIGEHITNLDHTYSHFRARLEVYYCTLGEADQVVNSSLELQWIEIASLSSVPMGKLDRQIAIRLGHDVG